jgi:hypothetical protein
MVNFETKHANWCKLWFLSISERACDWDDSPVCTQTGGFLTFEGDLKLVKSLMFECVIKIVVYWMLENIKAHF